MARSIRDGSDSIPGRTAPASALRQMFQIVSDTSSRLPGTQVEVGGYVAQRGLQAGVGKGLLSPTTVSRAFRLMETGFGPGINGALQVVVDLSSSDRSGADNVAAVIGRMAGIASARPIYFSTHGDQLLIDVFPTTGPTDPRTSDLLQRIRSALPAALRGTRDQAFAGGTVLQ